MTAEETMPEIPGMDILGKAGEGGMSTVWKARDLKRGKTVAVKLLNTEMLANPNDIAAFINEEKALESIRLPGVVEGYELACYAGRWYYVMEFVDGYNFNSLLQRKQHLPETDCLLICESVATALDRVWNDYGLVHCDIKPENIMINREGVVKLTDLGLCHTFRNAAKGSVVVPDHIMGTPAYISPEQIYGDVEPDCRADIYGLAATLYHLATGKILFPNLSNQDVLNAHCAPESRAKDPRAYRPELSDGFCRMLEAMLVKERDERIQSWQDVSEMCALVEQGGTFKPRASASPSSIQLFGRPSPKPVQKRGKYIVLGQKPRKGPTLLRRH